MWLGRAGMRGRVGVLLIWRISILHTISQPFYFHLLIVYDDVGPVIDFYISLRSDYASLPS